MSGPPPRNDGDLMAQFGLLLRVGVLASALVLVVGGSVYLFRHGSEPVPDRTTFEQAPPEYSRPALILQAALTGQGRAIIQLGLLLLIATPVVRVAWSVIAFARRRDRLYLALTATVLLVLILGLLSARVGR